MTQERSKQDLELHMARQEAGQSPFNQTIENLLYWSIIDMGNVWQLILCTGGQQLVFNRLWKC